MNLTSLVPKRLQKTLDSFPQEEKETLSKYIQRLEKHLKISISAKESSKETKNLLKLHEFLDIIEKRKGDKMDTDKMTLLEKALVPENGNLYKPKKKRNSKLLARSSSFEILNPFKDSTSFLKYYRKMLKSNNSEVKFEENSFESECRFAAQILDNLNLNNRDEKFLRMWIYNYLANSLKGDSITKTDKTSMYAFSKTFDIFNINYYG